MGFFKAAGQEHSFIYKYLGNGFLLHLGTPYSSLILSTNTCYVLLLFTRERALPSIPTLGIPKPLYNCKNRHIASKYRLSSSSASPLLTMAIVPSSKDHPASTSATRRRGEEERAGSEKLSGAEDDDLKKVSGTIGRLTKLRVGEGITAAFFFFPL